MAYASFWPVLLNTIAGVRTVDPLLIGRPGRWGCRTLRLFQKVILPSAVPTIFTGIRMAGAASILVLIAAEMVGAKAGLGYLIINAQMQLPDPRHVRRHPHRVGLRPAGQHRPGAARTALLALARPAGGH